MPGLLPYPVSRLPSHAEPTWDRGVPSPWRRSPPTARRRAAPPRSGVRSGSTGSRVVSHTPARAGGADGALHRRWRFHRSLGRPLRHGARAGSRRRCPRARSRATYSPRSDIAIWATLIPPCRQSLERTPADGHPRSRRSAVPDLATPPRERPLNRPRRAGSRLIDQGSVPPGPEVLPGFGAPGQLASTLPRSTTVAIARSDSVQTAVRSRPSRLAV